VANIASNGTNFLFLSLCQRCFVCCTIKLYILLYVYFYPILLNVVLLAWRQVFLIGVMFG